MTDNDRTSVPDAGNPHARPGLPEILLAGILLRLVVAMVEFVPAAPVLKGADRIVQVSDAEVTAAMRSYYEDTHQLTEGAGAASLAALMQERDRMKGRRIGLILSGGNIDREVYLRALADA